ncbi:peptidoglycan-binding domain-containing protein [Clostridium sp. UBA6640]|uniref:peptidoglycan-binding domain-containing protein n=1 Tax=Clostridium sp. UBA6640 TaxID=1946370 RepID=UPI0025BB13AD|nr:peptidoglycan-binding protein [Clostridium sp. UBA6640]
MKKCAILALTAVMTASILTVPAKALPTQPQGIVEGGCVLDTGYSFEDLPTCQFGDNNKFVEVLQWGLHIVGYEDLDEDGVFGPKTLKAVKDFQEKHDLEVDGIFHKEAWEVIRNVTFNILMEDHNRTHRHII